MKVLDRKAMWAMSFTAKMIYALVFLASILFLTQSAFGGLTDKASKSTCTASVMGNAMVRTPLLDTEIISVNCPTTFLTISTQDYEIRKGQGKPKVTKLHCGKPTGTSDTEYIECFLRQVNPVIAKELYDCWSKFAQGKKQVFSKYAGAVAQCSICTRIIFKRGSNDPDAFEDGKPFIFGENMWESSIDTDLLLDYYLRTHNPPLLPTMTYYEYLLDITDRMIPPYYGFNVDEIYAIVFTAVNVHNVERLASVVWDGLKQYAKITTKKKAVPPFVNALNFEKVAEISQLCKTI